MSNLPFFKSELLRMLEILASPAEGQVEYLKKMVAQSMKGAELVDELALDFDDAYQCSRELRDEGEISDRLYKALSEIELHFDSMSGNNDDHLWSFAGLRDREEWRRVRVLAGAALKLYRIEIPQ